MNIHSLICLAVLLAAPLLRADSLDDLARDFWVWRAIQQPVSDDDVNRIERAVDWLPDWSPAAVARYRGQLAEFESRWKKLDASAWPVPRQVDYRLMGSALARVRWELEFTRNWQRNPEFYIDQTLGAYFELLLPPPPFDAERTRHIKATLDSIPRILEDGRKNLTQPPAPFARPALAELQDIRPRLLKSVQVLKPYLDASAAAGLDVAPDRAAIALESYPSLRMACCLAGMGGRSEADVCRGPGQLCDYRIRSARQPRATIGYFAIVTARCTQQLVVPEGVPGPYFQLALGWANPDPTR